MNDIQWKMQKLHAVPIKMVMRKITWDKELATSKQMKLIKKKVNYISFLLFRWRTFWTWLTGGMLWDCWTVSSGQSSTRYILYSNVEDLLTIDTCFLDYI